VILREVVCAGFRLVCRTLPVAELATSVCV
jgi:hypothetical protein